MLATVETIKTPEKELTFLRALAATCNVTEACEQAGIGRATVYAWRETDPRFAADWEKAKAIGAEALEDEAMRRARVGVDEPVFYQGDACGAVRKYSDTLTIFLLKGAMPDKYRENSKVELAGSLALNSMSEEEIKGELATLLTSGIVLPGPEDVGDLV